MSTGLAGMGQEACIDQLRLPAVRFFFGSWAWTVNGSSRAAQRMVFFSMGGLDPLVKVGVELCALGAERSPAAMVFLRLTS
jgi:hypothetical protein